MTSTVAPSEAAPAGEAGAVADHTHGEGGADDQQEEHRFRHPRIDDRRRPRLVQIDGLVERLDVEAQQVRVGRVTGQLLGHRPELGMDLGRAGEVRRELLPGRRR